MAISVKFMKLHALGNDFVIIDAVTQHVRLSEEQVRHIADRHFGVGCDQLLLIEPPHSGEVDFSCRIFNADGGEVAQCGNGLRCVGRFIKEVGLSSRKTFSVTTLKNTNIIEILEHPLVRVNLGRPILNHQNPITLQFLDQSKQAHLVDMGNPHCIFFVARLDRYLLQQWGAALQTHPQFPSGVNVSLVECLAKNHIKMMTFERGVGETMACGSAASAAVVAGQLSLQLGQDVLVDLSAGSLNVAWKGENQDILLTGPTACTFFGQFVLNNFTQSA